jgi:transcriptional regulator with XRE-family HTH domain
MTRMADRDQFGPSLRKEREKRRITLETIAAATKVSVDLWEGLERNDLSRWPSGIFARAFVRDYARALGLDADAVVDEFCRLFPIGDRRATRIIEAQAELIGHKPEGLETPVQLPSGKDRRRNRRDRRPEPPPPRFSVYKPRVLAASFDIICVVGWSAGFSGFFQTALGPWLGALAILYFTGGTILTGSTPGARFIEELRHRRPALFTSRRTVNV